MVQKQKVFFVAFFLVALSGFSYWEWTPETGRWINPKYAVKNTPEEQFEWAEQFRTRGKTQAAIREHKKLLKYYADSDYAPRSCFILAEIFKESGNNKESFNYYQRIIDNYPQSPLVSEAIKKQSVIAEESLERQSFHLLDLEKEKKGDMLATVIENHPYAEDSAQRALKLGQFYLEIKDYDRAVEVFTMMEERYTDPAIVEEARFYLIKTGYLLIPEVSTDPKAYNILKTKIENFLSLYPDGTHKNEVIEIRKHLAKNEAKRYFEIATYYERAGKKNSAQYYYKIIRDNYPETDYGKIAAGKINIAD